MTLVEDDPKELQVLSYVKTPDGWNLADHQSCIDKYTYATQAHHAPGFECMIMLPTGVYKKLIGNLTRSTISPMLHSLVPVRGVSYLYPLGSKPSCGAG